jgi:hypothetical protein
MNNLMNLPPELLYKILSYLNVEDILQAVACCSVFHEQFSSDCRLWSFLCLRDYGVKPEYLEYAMTFYKNLLFRYNNLIQNTFRCGSMVVETKVAAKGLFGFYHVWAPHEEEKSFFEITMNSEGTINSSCCLNSGDLDSIRESSNQWEENHCASPHNCSVNVYISSLAPARHPEIIVKEYHVLRFHCDKGMLYRFKVMGVKGAFSGNTHSF